MVLKAMILAGMVALLVACGGGGTDPDPTATIAPTSRGQSSDPTATPTATPTTPTATPTNTPTPEVPAPETRGRLTLEQMEVWCADYNKRGEEKFAALGETGTWGDALEVLQFAHDGLASVTPPVELEEFWNAWQRTIGESIAVARDKPAGEQMQPEELFVDSAVQDSQQALQNVQQALEGEAYNVALYCAG